MAALAAAQQALLTAIDTVGMGTSHAPEVDALAARSTPPQPDRHSQAAQAHKPLAPKRPRVLPLHDGGSLHPLVPECIVVGMLVYALWSAPGNPRHYPAEVTAVYGAEGGCLVDV